MCSVCSDEKVSETEPKSKAAESGEDNILKHLDNEMPSRGVMKTEFVLWCIVPPRISAL